MKVRETIEHAGFVKSRGESRFGSLSVAGLPRPAGFAMGRDDDKYDDRYPLSASQRASVGDTSSAR